MKHLLAIIFTAIIAMQFNAVHAQGMDSKSMAEKAELPTVNPYFFQHQYLSAVVTQIAEFDGMILETPEILNTISPVQNGFQSPFTDDQIKVEKIEDEGNVIYVWQFPEPQYLREALYIAFVPINSYYKAFAISVGQTVDWEVSTSTDSYRTTRGRIQKPESPRKCYDLLKARGVLTGEITPGEFFQEGYKAPQYRP